MRIIRKICNKLAYLKKHDLRKRNRNEEKWLNSLRAKNCQKSCSIITNNCVGGVIYHNLGLRFDSPTINLFITGNEYLEFCKNLKYYSGCELVESTESMKNGYPIGIIQPKDVQHIPVSVNFQHYKDFQDAKMKWVERFSRVDYENVYFIWEFYDTLYDTKLVYEFDALPLKYKMIITHRKFEGLNNAAIVTCYDDDKPTAKILEHNGLSGKRFLDEIDYVSFLNQK